LAYYRLGDSILKLEHLRVPLVGHIIDFDRISNGNVVIAMQALVQQIEEYRRLRWPLSHISRILRNRPRRHKPQMVDVCKEMGKEVRYMHEHGIRKYSAGKIVYTHALGWSRYLFNLAMLRRCSSSLFS